MTSEPDDERDTTPEQGEDTDEAPTTSTGSPRPKVKVNLLGVRGLGKSYTNLAKAVRAPRVVPKDFITVPNVAGDALKRLRAETTWAKDLSVINSDVLKAVRVTPQMDSIFSQIAKNTDFGVSFAGFADQIARQHRETFKSIAAAGKKLSAAFYPVNLRDIEDLDFKTIEEVVLEDGIALYVVPRTTIAEVLMRAEGTEARLAIIDDEQELILEDCRAVLEECETEYVSEWVSAGIHALDAFESGYITAAQALVGALVDAAVKDYLKGQYKRYTPNKDTTTNAAYKELDVRSLIALGPIWQAYQKFHVGKDGIPVTFSRHATAHTVSKVQYTRRNTVQGLMLACSLTYFINDRELREQAAA